MFAIKWSGREETELGIHYRVENDINLAFPRVCALQSWHTMLTYTSD